MTITNTVRGALDNHLTGMAGVPSIAYQNVKFEPTTGVSYVKATLIPVRRRIVTLGFNQLQRYQGLYRILACTPESEGAGAGYTLADALLARFEAASEISFGGKIITINFAEVGTSFQDSPFYCTPVDIGWYIYN
jgi:hypothetical protein